MVSVAPYSANAKRLYKYYISELGYDERWIVPVDLKYYEDSGVFRRDEFCIKTDEFCIKMNDEFCV